MSALDEGVVTALQAAADQVAAEFHCPSLAWGVVADGTLVARGESADTVYRIASMTKSFTAAAVLSLRDEGVLELDRPVADYAPELRGVVVPAGSAPLTLRRLLSMSSGLATDDAWADRHLDMTADELDTIVAAGPLFAFRPDEVFQYSNLGFALIGRVVRRVTGSAVQEHIENGLLRPLRLSRTTWTMPDHDDWARPHRFQDGASVPEGYPPPGDGEMAPMGGLWSTVGDIGRWITWLDDANRAPDALAWIGLCPASRREMQRPHTFIGTRTVGERTAPAAYCFGLQIFQDAEIGRMISHSGGVPGYGSNMRWLAGRGLGVVALANTTYAPVGVATMRILAILHEHGQLPPAVVPLSPLLAEQSQRLVALLNAWDDVSARGLFAANMEPDQSFHRRATAAAELIDRHGAFSIVAIEPSSATSAKIDVQGSRDRLKILIDLAPLHGGPIQFYEVQQSPSGVDGS